MSGNSDGGIPSINRPSDNENCEGLVLNTNLASPRAEVIRSLSPGDVLNVQTASDQGPLQAFDLQGRLAGNIISREQVKLLGCILGGTIYEAEVLSVDNGQCRVQICAV